MDKIPEEIQSDLLKSYMCIYEWLFICPRCGGKFHTDGIEDNKIIQYCPTCLYSGDLYYPIKPENPDLVTMENPYTKKGKIKANLKKGKLSKAIEICRIIN